MQTILQNQFGDGYNSKVLQFGEDENNVAWFTLTQATEYNFADDNNEAMVSDNSLNLVIASAYQPLMHGFPEIKKEIIDEAYRVLNTDGKFVIAPWVYDAQIDGTNDYLFNRFAIEEMIPEFAGSNRMLLVLKKKITITDTASEEMWQQISRRAAFFAQHFARRAINLSPDKEESAISEPIMPPSIKSQPIQQEEQNQRIDWHDQAEQKQFIEPIDKGKSNDAEEEFYLPVRPDPKHSPIRYMRPLSPDEEPSVPTTGDENPGSSQEHTSSIDQNKQNALVNPTNLTTSRAESELVNFPQSDQLPIGEQVLIDQSKINDFQQSCNVYIAALQQRTELEKEISNCIRARYGRSYDQRKVWVRGQELCEQELNDLNKQIASQHQELYDKVAMLSDGERAELNRAALRTSVEEQLRLVTEHKAKGGSWRNGSNVTSNVNSS